MPASIPQAELGDDERHVKSLDTAGISESHCTKSAEGDRQILKVLRLAEADRWKAVELFEREAQVLQQLDHPGIPAYLDFRTDIREPEGPDSTGAVTLTIRREWVAGESLHSRIEASYPEPALEASQLGNFLEEALDILGYLHSQNPPVVHRDVTPEHFIVTPEGALKLVGFGGLQSILPRTRGGSTFVGTRGYMAVEQMMGRAVPASDLYGLAATAVHLVTGDHPGGFTHSDDIENLRARLEQIGVPAGQIALLESMLQPEPDDRPIHAQAAARRLNHTTALTDASNIKLTLIDNPPPDSIKTYLAENSSPESASLTIPRENSSTNLWTAVLFSTILALLNISSFAGDGAWAIYVAIAGIVGLSLHKLLTAVTTTNQLKIEGSRFGAPGQFSTSAAWDFNAVDAIIWDRDDDDRSFYQVVVEVDGSAHTIATRLSRRSAVWLADFLQRLRGRRSNRHDRVSAPQGSID